MRPVVVVAVVAFVVVVFVFVMVCSQNEIFFTRVNLWSSRRPVVVVFAVVIVVAFVVVVFVFVEKSKSCSLDVIFDAPRILLHLRKREAAKLALGDSHLIFVFFGTPPHYLGP